MAFLCKVGFHNWKSNCEKCSNCGKKRINKKSRINCGCNICTDPDKRTIFFFSDCELNNIRKVRHFLESPFGRNFNLDSRDYKGKTAISIAAAKGHLEIIKLLLNKGASINSQNEDGLTSFHEAVYNEHLEIVKFLLKKGAQTDLKTKHGATALLYYGDKAYRRMDIVKLLLELNKEPETEVKKWSRFAIYNACSTNKYENLKLLLEYGFGDINYQDKEGKSALYFAIIHGDLEIVKLLVNNGAKLEHDGIPPLEVAAHRGNIDTVKFLLDNGANVNFISENSLFPLYQAAREGRLEIVKLLLERGARTDAQDSLSWTALHCASKRGHIEVVKLLLAKGAKRNILTNEGQTAYDVAKDMEIRRLLR